MRIERRNLGALAALTVAAALTLPGYGYVRNELSLGDELDRLEELAQELPGEATLSERRVGAEPVDRKCIGAAAVALETTLDPQEVANFYFIFRPSSSAGGAVPDVALAWKIDPHNSLLHLERATFEVPPGDPGNILPTVTEELLAEAGFEDGRTRRVVLFPRGPFGGPPGQLLVPSDLDPRCW